MNARVSLLTASITIAIALGVAAASTGAVYQRDVDQPWIAYQTSRDGSEAVWLIHPDGTGDHRIAQGVNHAGPPDWSPDGTHLVFATRGGEHEPAYVYDLASGRSRELFACESSCLGDDEPAYAPDGTTVAVVRALGPFVGTYPPTAASGSAT